MDQQKTLDLIPDESVLFTMTALEKLGKDLGITTSPQKVLDQIGAALSKNQIIAQQVNILTGKVRDGSMTGSGTLKDPYSLGAQGIGTKGEIQGASLSSYGNPLKDFGEFGIGQKLKNFAYNQGLVMGDYFSAEDDKGKVSVFRVKDEDGNVVRVKNPYEKAMGGAIRKYGNGSMGGVWGPGSSTSDSIPALLSNGEYVLNAAATQKFGIPLLDQMNGSYNIPSSTKSMGTNIINSPSSNNVYNIEIALNGTNVTADDVINRMKREMALVNAKEGINRRVGA